MQGHQVHLCRLQRPLHLRHHRGQKSYGLWWVAQLWPLRAVPPFVSLSRGDTGSTSTAGWPNANPSLPVFCFGKIKVSLQNPQDPLELNAWSTTFFAGLAFCFCSSGARPSSPSLSCRPPRKDEASTVIWIMTPGFPASSWALDWSSAPMCSLFSSPIRVTGTSPDRRPWSDIHLHHPSITMEQQESQWMQSETPHPTTARICP